MNQQLIIGPTTNHCIVNETMAKTNSKLEVYILSKLCNLYGKLMSIFLGYLAYRKGFAFKCFSLLLRSLQMAMDICNYVSLTQQ